MIIDAHCDVLLKLWSERISFRKNKKLQINNMLWKNSPVKVQCFAIFIPSEVPEEFQFQAALEMIDIFFEEIIEPYDDIKFISNKNDLLSLEAHERGAMLTLEGCHAIGNDLNKLKTLVRLGVRSVGLTWNQANAVCDGIGEKRGAGLTSFGEEVINLLNKEKIWVDVSHISYNGFFDVMNCADYVMASHSNAFSLCDHRRNLDDQQIKSIIDKQGWIGVTFVPQFTNRKELVTYEDVIEHILYYLEIGAGDCLGFGSDFDGIDQYISGLEDITGYKVIQKVLNERIPTEQFQKITHQNFIDKFPRKKD